MITGDALRAWKQGDPWPWSLTEIEELKRLYADPDLSFAEVCGTLHRSRGSVAGKARKIGITRNVR